MSLPIEVIATRIAERFLRMYGLEGLSKLLKHEPTVDERLQKLTKIQEDLGEVLLAVSELQRSALTSKQEAADLELEVSQLREDRAVAEELIKVPEEAFARMLSRASAKGRGRGLFEGITVGLFTGIVSSYLVWYLTTSQ
ncbi:hypothetical protein ACE1B4_02190 [Aeromonas veronii]|uniref:hypothetical protein n=1 Tax=Aeromonas veronii TaxID=654 RepID=UPI0011169D11|nr:hypothetical protein [Aeromonas veronii]MBL0612959.1 hypothetical protein [Aeromonas veronii]TNI06167.1 hypothetical protein CF135_10970 [Aeromonas veronii]HDO1310024.1 hypothetical protein [Aeromonas veronii]